jgi:signal transduction histidine kinase
MSNPTKSIRHSARRRLGLEYSGTDLELSSDVRRERLDGESDRDSFRRRAAPLLRLLRWRESEDIKRRNMEFLATFSHELRNSLAAIQGAAETLRLEKPPTPGVEKARAVIHRQVGQMTRLVDDLLDVARIRSGQLCLRRERIDMCVIVAQALQAVEFRMQQRGHRLTASLPQEPVWLQADPVRMEQVLVNLLVNAWKYTDAGGDIAVFVEVENDEVIFRIRDTGVGIPPDVLPDIFDFFFQADPSSRRTNAGLGIGLALVRNLVESHGGRVSAASAGHRKGSEFTVRLPRNGVTTVLTPS